MLLLLQTPAPLPPVVPPTPSPGPETLFLDPRLQETILFGLLIIASAVVAIFVLRPFFRAIANRIEGKAVPQNVRAEIDQLREQVGEVEGLRQRMHELEDRLEFTERLLAQRRDQELLGRGGQG
jgi:hypothetical protein